MRLSFLPRLFIFLSSVYCGGPLTKQLNDSLVFCLGISLAAHLQIHQRGVTFFLPLNGPTLGSCYQVHLQMGQSVCLLHLLSSQTVGWHQVMKGKINIRGVLYFDSFQQAPGKQMILSLLFRIEKILNFGNFCLRSPAVPHLLSFNSSRWKVP